MGLGQRRGRAGRARHHHNRAHHHHRNHAHGVHHHHQQAGFGGMFRRQGNARAYPLQRRLWSGFIMIMIGFALFCYGAVSTAITTAYGYFYQGPIYLVVGAVLILSGILLIIKVYHLHRVQSRAGAGVVIQAGPGINTTAGMQLQQQPPSNIWMTGQNGSADAPPPTGTYMYGSAFGQPPPGYPVHVETYPPEYPPGGQPPYGQPPPEGQPPFGQPPPGGQPPYGQPLPGGQPPYGQPPPEGQPPYGQPPPEGQPPYGQPLPGGQPPYGQPLPGGAPPSQAWQGGAEATINPGTQMYPVQPTNQPTDQINAQPPEYNTQGPPDVAFNDPPPPSYDEVTKTQHI